MAVLEGGWTVEGTTHMAKDFREVRGFLFAWILVLATTGLVSCGGTTLRDVWRDPQYQGGPLKKVAVLVVDRDESRRRMAEDLIVENLPGGAQAVAGYRIFGPLDASPDRAKVRDRLVAEGYDGAVVARLVGIIQKETSQPSQTYVAPTSPSEPSFYVPGGSFDLRYPGEESPDPYGYVVTSPGYTKESTDVVVEVQLFVFPGGKPIWRGITDSMNPDSREALVERITEVVGRRLRSEGLLGSS